MKTISIKAVGFLFFLSFLSCSEGRDETLVLIPDGKKIAIEALPAGHTTIYQSRNVFFHVSSFEYKGLENEQIASEETIVNVYKSKQKITTFSEMFNSLNSDLKKLCLTQSQIVSFCQKNSQHLCQGGPTFFLIENNNGFLVVRVHSFANGLQASFDRFEDKDPLLNVVNYHLVVPAI